MEELVLGVCPFCGKEIVTSKINPLYVESLNLWSLSHFCCRDSNGDAQVSISITGKTKEEVIERCLTSLHRKDDNNA